MKRIGITGQRFNRLTVIKLVPYPKNPKLKIWLCKCDCGNTTLASYSNLTGTKKSCGCLHKEVCIQRGKDSRKYSKEALLLKDTYTAMIRRCTNPKDKDYHRYGDRGITVCDRWLESLNNFYADMGPKPSKNYTLDRTDNDGNYTPENCRWATKKEQANNRRLPYESISG